jgi:predicted DNA-binding antitoxin AbrB/MazE fold protein
MDAKYVPAIFEAGKLCPLVPLDLEEHERVKVAVLRAGDNSDDVDDIYVPGIIVDANSAITLEQVQQALAKIPGSLVDDFARERDERF